MGAAAARGGERALISCWHSAPRACSGSRVRSPRRSRHNRGVRVRCSTAGTSSAPRYRRVGSSRGSLHATRISRREHSDQRPRDSFAPGSAWPGRSIRSGWSTSSSLRRHPRHGSELVRLACGSPPTSRSPAGSPRRPRFRETLVLCRQARPRQHGRRARFYGSRLRVGYASAGGWDAFAPSG